MKIPRKVEMTEMVAYDVLARIVIAYLVLALAFACVLAVLFPDVWWLWSWTPSP